MKHSLNDIANRIARESYNRALRDALQIIQRLLNEPQKASLVAGTFRSRKQAARDFVPNKSRTFTLQSSSLADTVYEVVCTKPGITSAEIKDIIRNGESKHARNPKLMKRIYTNLGRLKGRLIEKRDNAWHPKAA